jgi:hypothetical protein
MMVGRIAMAGHRGLPLLLCGLGTSKEKRMMAAMSVGNSDSTPLHRFILQTTLQLPSKHGRNASASLPRCGGE